MSDVEVCISRESLSQNNSRNVMGISPLRWASFCWPKCVASCRKSCHCRLDCFGHCNSLVTQTTRYNNYEPRLGRGLRFHKFMLNRLPDGFNDRLCDYCVDEHFWTTKRKASPSVISMRWMTEKWDERWMKCCPHSRAAVRSTLIVSSRRSG